MVILAIDDDQVLALVAQLPSERKVWWRNWSRNLALTPSVPHRK